MEKSKKINSISSSEIFNKNSISTSNKIQSDLDFSEMINELTEFNKEGDSLFKQSKIEEAKNKYLLGYDIFKKENEKSLNLLTMNPKIIQILPLYKDLLSKIADCFYLQKNYDDSIDFDLKLICLEPKNVKSIVRLFYSYSKKEKYPQAIFYGDLFMDLDKDIKDEFKDVQRDIENIKLNREKMRFNILIILFIYFFKK